MVNWLRRLPLPDWIKAGVIGAIITYFVFSLIPSLFDFSLEVVTWWNWLDILATPILTGWLVILLFDSPYRKAFTKGMLAGLVCFLGRFVPFGIGYLANPSMAADISSTLSFLIAIDLARLAFSSFVSGMTSRFIANRQPRLNLVVTSYVGAIQSGNKAELNRIIGQQVTCNKCGATVLVREAWLVRHNNDLVCPKCNEVWVKTVITNSPV